MNTNILKSFAQEARKKLLEQVEVKLDYVLNTDTPELRQKTVQIEKLRAKVEAKGKDSVIRYVAYVWFNRFMAICFMDASNYSDEKVVRAREGATQPEILANARSGVIDPELNVDSKRIANLLNGSIKHSNPINEVYKMLLIAACNNYYKLMPFMFEDSAHYTELLMPDDLLSEQSITHQFMQLDAENINEVESIGWMYQFYISEKKDEVFADLKKNIKITSENIPAATQLFTPNWIVRYLVENSLGRLWMLNNPGSKLKEHMDYYIEPETAEEDYLKISSPEEIRICDPACGSGHMLVYAFDLLTKIYEEAFYDTKEIPKLILEKNLYGIEIDERAGELAKFALFMKARAYYRRFFRNPVQPNICVLENIDFEDGELNTYMDSVGDNLFTLNLQTALHQFTNVENFGSLIRPEFIDVHAIQDILQDANVDNNVFLFRTHKKVLKALEMTDYLSPKYHVVVANPPYMGGKGMNTEISIFAKKNYSDSKSDLFAMFIERGFELVIDRGYNAMVTMQSWMFLSSYGKLRQKLLSKITIECMAHMGNMVMGIAFGTNATVWQKTYKPDRKGHFSYVDYKDLNNNNIPSEFPVQNERLKTASAEDFKKIPGSPIAYWVSEQIRNLFVSGFSLEDITISDGQNITANNDTYLRNFWEISKSQVGIDKKWFFYAKGGEFRKWWGNLEHVVDWSPNARGFYRHNNSARIISEYLWYKIGVTWTLLSSGKTGFRYLPKDATFDKTGSSVFLKDDTDVEFVTALLCSNVSTFLLGTFSSTIAYQIKEIRKIPVTKDYKHIGVVESTRKLFQLSEIDYNNVETSWNFTENLMVKTRPELDLHAPMHVVYAHLRNFWQEMTQEMQKLEIDNNRIFIEAYGLQDELTPHVPSQEITLTCNPHYRYGGNKSDEQLEALLQADTMKEFISYAVACMFGRYSLDTPGLVLANQGETVEDYLSKVSNPSFEPDADNVIPILDGEWFTDCIVERFKQFLKVTFGELNFVANLTFIEDSLGKDIRKYFVKDFYTDHVKRYKKRPIYWMFSSPKGHFNALIYMHRYRPDTVSVVLNEYLREFENKLKASRENYKRRSTSESLSEHDKREALKGIDNINKMLSDISDYEQQTLYPLATEKIAIDLDDGVKVNYTKFGKALKKVPGLSK